jgi:hypothetical protein
MTVLLSYAACEGLLLQKDDDDTRFGVRLAILTSENSENEKRLRRIAARWMEVRGFAAHGQRPAIEVMATFLEEQLNPADLAGSPLGVDRTRRRAKERAAALLRRVFLAMLFACVDLDSEGSPRARYSREEILDLLEQAASGSNEARKAISVAVPAFVRNIEF